MRAQDLDRLVGARIVISDDRVHVAGEIVERVGQDQRLVAHPRHGHEPMLLPEQGFIACDDVLLLPERPAFGAACHVQNRATTAAIQMSAVSAMTQNTPAEARSLVTLMATCFSGCR